LLPNGLVLVAGGEQGANVFLSGAELYDSRQIPASVTLGNLAQTYDGTAKSVSVSTTPPGLVVNVTYNGSANAPTNPGSYTVIGTINELYYQGSATNTLVISFSAPVTLTGATVLPNGAFQFAFANNPGLAFQVVATTNLALPPNAWIALGVATEVSPGQYQFTDPEAPTNPQRFYRVRSP
jgi:hypothetical protein